MMMRMCVVIVMNVVAAIIAAIIATIIAAIIAAIYNFFKTSCNVPSDTRSLCQPNSGHPSLRSSAVAAITDVFGCATITEMCPTRRGETLGRSSAGAITEVLGCPTRRGESPGRSSSVAAITEDQRPILARRD